MIFLVGILAILCLGLIIHDIRVRKQLLEWLDYLKNAQEEPDRKVFVQGSGTIAEINFQINQILANNREQLAKAAKSELASRQILTNLSHDVRTPLASLLGYLEALVKNGVQKEEQEEYLQVAYRKALDMRELVDILFVWFQLNAKEQVYHLAPYDINELTRQLIIGYLPVAQQEGITVTTEIPEEEYWVLLDAVAYERIIDNLFKNAVKHGKCTRIIITVQKKEESIAVTVANNGKVISAEHLPYLFERLYRCDPSRPQGGSGLGLAIAKELAEAMDGVISVESTDKEGTLFTVQWKQFRKK